MGWFDFTIITPSAEYSSDQTLASSTRYVVVDASGQDVTITLGAAADNNRTLHTIKKIDSSLNKVIIDASGTEKIDGETTVELKLQYQYITVICDGDEWFIIGGEYVKLEDTISDLLDEQTLTKELLEKAVYILAKIEKHEADSSEAEPDEEEIEEELRNMIVEVVD